MEDNVEQCLIEDPDKKGYFRDKRESDQEYYIAQYNQKCKEKNGIAFHFINGKIASVDQFSKGTHIMKWIEFNYGSTNPTMTVLDNGSIVYKGGFSGNYLEGFVRSGKGKEFEMIGGVQTLVFDGQFHEDMRDGEGIYFENGYPRYRGQWKPSGPISLPNGEGILYDQTGGYMFSSQWKDGFAYSEGVWYDYESLKSYGNCGKSCFRRRVKKLKKSVL